MRHAKHLSKRAQTITAPPVTDVDWATLPRRPVMFAEHYRRAFANAGCIGIEVHVDELKLTWFRIWLWTKERGLSVYFLLRTIEPNGDDS
jgi:hypothetical protein